LQSDRPDDEKRVARLGILSISSRLYMNMHDLVFYISHGICAAVNFT
jgi:hypothetical protein